MDRNVHMRDYMLKVKNVMHAKCYETGIETYGPEGRRGGWDIGADADGGMANSKRKQVSRRVYIICYHLEVHKAPAQGNYWEGCNPDVTDYSRTKVPFTTVSVAIVQWRDTIYGLS